MLAAVRVSGIVTGEDTQRNGTIPYGGSERPHVIQAQSERQDIRIG